MTVTRLGHDSTDKKCSSQESVQQCVKYQYDIFFCNSQLCKLLFDAKRDFEDKRMTLVFCSYRLEKKKKRKETSKKIFSKKFFKPARTNSSSSLVFTVVFFTTASVQDHPPREDAGTWSHLFHLSC